MESRSGSIERTTPSWPSSFRKASMRRGSNTGRSHLWSDGGLLARPRCFWRGAGCCVEQPGAVRLGNFPRLDDHELRHLIGMQSQECLLQRRDALIDGLDQQQLLVLALDLALPSID